MLTAETKDAVLVIEAVNEEQASRAREAMLELHTNTQLFSKSNLVHCLLTVDFKTLFSSPRITS